MSTYIQNLTHNLTSISNQLHHTNPTLITTLFPNQLYLTTSSYHHNR